MSATQPAYPLGESAGRDLKSASGRPLAEIEMGAVLSDAIASEDLRISAETLHLQAAIARQAGYDRLAVNLSRAAELTRVPNEELLRMYEALRPRRSSYEGLLALAERLKGEYDAPHTAQFVREAAEVYRLRGLLEG